MRGVVYVDVLVLTNALIGWFLLRAAGRLSACFGRPWQLAAAAFLAGGSSLLLLCRLPALAALAVKLLCAVLTVAVAFWPRRVRAMLCALAWYLALQLAVGGLAAVLISCGAGNLKIRNFSLYLHISPVLLIGCILAVYGGVELCSLAFGRPRPGVHARFTATVRGAPVTGAVLVDTGLSLRDSMTGGQAALVSFPAIERQLPPAVRAAVAGYFANGTVEADGVALCLQAVKTAAGARVLPAVRAERFALSLPRARPRQNVLLVFCNETLGEGAEAMVCADFIK